MADIRIFIASSFDTEHERAVVGDAVRKLNDLYEPQGWRIRLHCWEDYEPTYRGLRKQSEYNEDLIKKSDLFIALFRGNCGQFTQAIQLKGSILYYGGHKKEGLALLKQAWDWNLLHPENNYADRFRGVAGEILEKEGMV